MWTHFADLIRNLFYPFSLCLSVQCELNHQPFSQRCGQGIYYNDLAVRVFLHHFFGTIHNILITAGQSGGKADMQNILSLGCDLRKLLQNHRRIAGCSPYFFSVSHLIIKLMYRQSVSLFSVYLLFHVVVVGNDQYSILLQKLL